MEIFGVIEVPLWALLCLAVLLTAYLWLTRNFNYFKNQGIPGPKPLPLIGTLYDELLKHNLYKEREYLKYGKTIGLFFGSAPVLWSADEDILRECMVKKFNAFPDRLPPEVTPGGFFKQMLLTASGFDWQRIRRLLTPAFSGAKLKQMNAQINKCSKMLEKNLSNLAENGQSANMKEYCGAFTMDVIASIAFGLDIDSQKDVNNPFVVMAKRAIQGGTVTGIIRVMPWMMNIADKLGLEPMPKSVINFFRNITKKTIDQRIEHNLEQVDFLQLMMTAEQDIKTGFSEEMNAFNENMETNTASKAAELKGLSRDEILSNAVLFFLAGYETTASTLSFLLYNLAVNPDVQEKLHQEVQEYFAKHKTVQYSSLQELTYMEQCISETLRMFPPLPKLFRTCATDTTLGGINIKKGMTVIIPVFAIHYNPEYYPDPERFDPERFSNEASTKRNPYHFMSFGFGPRHCIGMRLALTELKIVVAHLVKNLRFIKCDKTQVPLKLSRKPPLAAQGGVWLKVERRIPG